MVFMILGSFEELVLTCCRNTQARTIAETLTKVRRETVSIGAVRMALTRLQKRGLITVGKADGVMTFKATPDGDDQIYVSRRVRTELAELEARGALR